MNERPPNFECPWCGPHGVPIDRTLPAHLQICDDCQAPRPPAPPLPPDPAHEAHKESLRVILQRHITSFYGEHWKGCEFGKTIIGNAILGAMKDIGMDPKVELEAVLAQHKR